MKILLFSGICILLFPLFPAKAAWGNACVGCHQRLESGVGRAHNFAEWEKSVHAQKGVTCEKCHGGDPEVDEPIKAHQKVLKPHQQQSPLYYTRIPETCGACHEAELGEFKKSAHYQEMKKTEHGPNCVTCHGSMAVGILDPGHLEQTCSLCHQERRNAKEALVTLNLAARGVKNWSEAISEAKERGGNVVEQEGVLKEQEKALSVIRRQWHTFAMKEVMDGAAKISNAARSGVEAVRTMKGGK